MICDTYMHARFPFPQAATMKIRGKKNSELDLLRQRRIVELKAESELQKRISGLNARLAAIVACSEDAIIGKDMQGIITSWNKGAEKIYGYTPEEAIGKSIAVLCPSDHQDETRQILERVGRGENIAPYETVRIRKDGERIVVSLMVSPVRDSFGAITGASTIARDITERRRAEDKIRIQAQILNQIQDAVITTDLEGYITSWNRGAANMFCYTSDEAMGRHISLIYPEDRHEFLKEGVIEPLMKKGEHRCEVRLRRKTGEEFDALLQLTLLRGEAEEVVGMVGSSVDITELKRAEEQIRLAKEEWEQTFDAIPDMVAVIDNQRIITKANAAMVVAVGISREEIIGRACYGIFHGT